MSDRGRKHMIAAYIEENAQPPGFLTSMFQTPARNYFQSESVEVDIQRSSNDISVPIPDITVKGRLNEVTRFTNKEFVPPIFEEIFPVKAWEQMYRTIGMNPFESEEYMTSATRSMLSNMRRGEDMIRRSIEVQASQVFQSGTVTLTDSSGATVYTIDFAPKSTHFVNAGTTWASSTTKLADIEALAQVIRIDGKTNANMLIFGSRAWNRFMADTTVQNFLDVRRFELGSISQPMQRGGGSYHGTLTVGDFTFELWTYGGWYTHPQTGVATPYIDQDSVIMRGPGRLDLVYGAVPRLVRPDPRVAPLALGRVSGEGSDMFTHAWLSEDEKTVFGSVSARPLVIPTAIDTFGRIDTVP